MDAQTARRLLSYDPMTGILTWIVSCGKKAKVGKIAGSRLKGYAAVMVFGKTHAAHRLAWLITYGEFPPCAIDHANGDKSDNRLCNLRLAEPSQNACNRGPSPLNRSGFKGVHLHKQTQKWRARIAFQGRVKSLGLFDTREQAAAAYDAAAVTMHGEFARLNMAA